MAARKRVSVVGSRFVSGRLPLITIVAVLLAVAIPVALALDSSGADVPAAKPSPEAVDVCEEARETCASIQADGRVWRYSLLKSQKPTDQTVIVDLGGPGISALSGSRQLGIYKRDLPEIRDYNMLVVEEPWVTAELSETCRQSASSYYGSVRNGSPDVVARAKGLSGACDIGSGRWGFSPRTYSDVVTVIKAKESLNLKGFIGHSFGSARYSYLSQSSVVAGLEWAVLVRPFPLEVDAKTFVLRRAELTQSAFGQVATGGAALPAPAGRSLDVTAFDQLSALAGLGNAVSVNEAVAVKAIVRDNNAETVGQFSDALWHRYGTGSISPAYLAQLDEICASTRSNEQLAAIADNRSLPGIIASTILPCASAPPVPATLPGNRLCIITSTSDPVVAGDLALRMTGERSHPMVTYESAQTSHSSRDGLQYCLKEIMGQP